MAQMPVEPRHKLQYICDMLEQLRMLAPLQVGPMLPYFLDMARIEASEALVRFPQRKSET